MARVPEDFERIIKAGRRGLPKPLRTIGIKKYHALSPEQRRAMIQSGFLPKEIKEFDNSLATSFTSSQFQNMIRSRRKWTEAMVLNQWTPKEIYTKLQHYYRKKETRSPWDFFRMEYAQLSQRPILSASKFSNFLDIRKEVSRNLGRAYGRIQSVKKAAYTGLKGIPRKR